MKGNNQNNYDRRPKRRKDKLNPYTIYSVGINTDDHHYYVSFVDVNNNRVNVEVCKEVFNAFDQFELEDLSHFNEVTNHYDGSDSLEEIIINRSIEESVDSFEIVFNRMISEEIHNAISLLTENQKRRIFLFFFEGLKYREIAEIEGCGYQRVKNSINRGLKKIKKILIDRGVF